MYAQSVYAQSKYSMPPPEGFDIDDIVTEAGLLAAIQREADKICKAKKAKTRVSKDTIRRISFLAGEVRCKIENLSPEEKIEFQRIRDTAPAIDFERRANEIMFDVKEFIEAINKPGAAVGFSRINELEDRTESLMLAFGDDPKKYVMLLENMMDTLEKLHRVKNKGAIHSGLQKF